MGSSSFESDLPSRYELEGLLEFIPPYQQYGCKQLRFWDPLECSYLALLRELGGKRPISRSESQPASPEPIPHLCYLLFVSPRADNVRPRHAGTGRCCPLLSLSTSCSLGLVGTRDKAQTSLLPCTRVLSTCVRVQSIAVRRIDGNTGRCNCALSIISYAAPALSAPIISTYCLINNNRIVPI
jgi:hypothetical protein